MKLKIDLKAFKYFWFLLIVIQPKIFTQYKMTTLIYAVANVILFLYFILRSKYIKIHFIPPIYIWLFTRVYLLLLMLLNHNFQAIDQWGYLSLMVFNIYFIINLAISKKEISKLLHAGTILSIILLGINAFSLLYFKDGIISSPNLYDNGDGDFYFLGIKVAYTTYILSALSFAALNMKLNDRKYLFVIVILLSLFNIFYANISTGIICIIVIICALFIQKRKIIELNIKRGLIFSIILNVLFVFFNIQTLFSNIIVNVLHKSITLTGRTEIWSLAIEYFKNNGLFNLIFGNGIVKNGSFIRLGGDYWPAHNTWLQFAYEFGIIGIIAFMVMILLFDKNKNIKSFERYFLLSICFAIFVATITMSYFGYAHIYIPFILLWYLNDIMIEKEVIFYEKERGKINK